MTGRIKTYGFFIFIFFCNPNQYDNYIGHFQKLIPHQSKKKKSFGWKQMISISNMADLNTVILKIGEKVRRGQLHLPVPGCVRSQRR